MILHNQIHSFAKSVKQKQQSQELMGWGWEIC